MPGGFPKMNQSNERTFFNESNIYISQFRFVTPDGRTYPTRALQSTYLTLERPWGCLTQIVILLLGLFGIVVAFPIIFSTLGLILWYAVEDSRGEFFFGDVGMMWGIAILSALTMTVVILGWKITLARRRRQWTANFMFAGGGDFSTVGGVTSSGTITSSSRRRPDYSVWSYDREWIEHLIAAANEAMIATQQN